MLLTYCAGHIHAFSLKLNKTKIIFIYSIMLRNVAISSSESILSDISIFNTDVGKFLASLS